MTQPPATWITLAHILRPQGRRGEVLAELLTDFPDQITERREFFLAAPAASGIPPRPIQVLGSWLPHGKNEGRIVLELADISSIAEAERLAGFDLVIEPAARAPLPDDSVYISDLCGLHLFNGTSELGVVTDVSFPLSPDGRRRLADAAPLLVVESPTGAEILVPFAKSYLVRIDTAAKRLDMQLPSGLDTLNSSEPDEDLHGHLEAASEPE